MIDVKIKEIDELDTELRAVQDACIKFALFLKHNAITPYNDAMVAYLNHLIIEEGRKVACGGKNKVRESLKMQLLCYEQQVTFKSVHFIAVFT